MLKLKNLIFQYYKKYGSVPSIQHVINLLTMNKKQVENGYKKLVKQGMIKLIGDKYFMNIKNVDTTKERVGESAKSDHENADGFSFNIVRIVMGVIALISIIISSAYTKIWLNNFVNNDFFSWVWAVTMIAFEVFAWQVALMFKDRNKIISYALYAMSIIVILFSIVSTVGGQYRSDIEKNEKIVQQVEQEKLILMKAEEKSLVESIESTKQELNDNTHMLGQFKKEEMESKEYKNIFWKSFTLRELRKKYEDQLRIKREDIRKFTFANSSVINEQNTFYTWASEFLPLRSSSIEFILYMFPACFVDIMSVLGMTIALETFRRRKETK